LWSEDRRRISEDGGHVAGDQQVDAGDPPRRADGLHRSKASVGGGAAAETDDDSASTGSNGGEDEFANTGGGGVERTILFSPSCDGEPRGERHFDDGGPPIDAPAGVNRSPERPGHPIRAVWATKYLKQSFAPVSKRHFGDLVAEVPARITDCGCHLMRGGGAAKFVDGGEDAHDHNLVRSAVTNSDSFGSLSVMAVTVRIPTTLRPMSGGAKQVEVEPGTLREVIASLDAAHAGFADRLLDDEGGLRKFVNIFVDDDDVRYLDGLNTAVADGITVSIIPAVAGGA
jgi:molybdopterin synthase sulfur carrier subunit